MDSKKIRTALGLTAIALTLVGCATEPTLTERNFGDSVRQMIEAQTYDPATLVSPSAEAVEGGDGQRLQNVLEAYRSDVAKPESVSDDIVISVGEGQR